MTSRSILLSRLHCGTLPPIKLATLGISIRATVGNSRIVASLDRKRLGHSFGANQNLDSRRFRFALRMAPARDWRSPELSKVMIAPIIQKSTGLSQDCRRGCAEWSNRRPLGCRPAKSLAHLQSRHGITRGRSQVPFATSSVSGRIAFARWGP
jgi:hypothetical protein